MTPCPTAPAASSPSSTGSHPPAVAGASTTTVRDEREEFDTSTPFVSSRPLSLHGVEQRRGVIGPLWSVRVPFPS